MSATGYIQVNAYTSDARIPLEGTAIAILSSDGTLIAARLTNSSGQIIPVPISVPDLADSLDPSFVGQPFASVTIRAQSTGYEQIQVDRVQVFPGILTLQPLEMVPTPLYTNSYNGTEYFDVPPQNL